MNLSIVIPLLNEQESLPELHQWIVKVMTTHNYSYEVIFIDDGSTDQTEEAVLPFLSHQVRYFKIENSERGAARNQGTQLARGMYMNWFDSDDEMLPNHVATIESLASQYQFGHISLKILLLESIHVLPIGVPFLTHVKIKLSDCSLLVRLSFRFFHH